MRFTLFLLLIILFCGCSTEEKETAYNAQSYNAYDTDGQWRIEFDGDPSNYMYWDISNGVIWYSTDKYFVDGELYNSTISNEVFGREQTQTQTYHYEGYMNVEKNFMWGEYKNQEGSITGTFEATRSSFVIVADG